MSTNSQEYKAGFNWAKDDATLQQLRQIQLRLPIINSQFPTYEIPRDQLLGIAKELLDHIRRRDSVAYSFMEEHCGYVDFEATKGERFTFATTRLQDFLDGAIAALKARPEDIVAA